MRSIDTFSACHPVVNFLFFAEVLIFTMFFMHPVSLVISLAAALTYALWLHGRKAVRVSLLALLPMMVLAAAVNVLFNHEGATILTYLPSGNPLTGESICYGAASSLMLAAVITWFSCYSAVMSSDKFVYLFGRIIPALSLVLSMTLRFVPKFRARFRVVAQARQCMGQDVHPRSFKTRIKYAAATVSAMVTWSLENAIETADSMKGRGYGLKGRTAFSIYRFDERDKALTAWLGFCGLFILGGWLCGGFDWRYYPIMQSLPKEGAYYLLQAVYLALCLTPVIVNAREERIWKHLRSAL